MKVSRSLAERSVCTAAVPGDAAEVAGAQASGPVS
jgi:hypothetical protein